MTLLQKVVEAESGGLTFATLGAGRGLLVPWCNVPWPELPLIDRLAESYRVVLASPRGYPRLMAICRAWLAYVQREVFPGGCFFAAASFEFDGRPGAVRDAIALAMDAWLETLEKAVRLARDEGHLDLNVDPPQLAFELNALFFGANFAWNLRHDKKAFARAERAIVSRLDAVLLPNVGRVRNPSAVAKRPPSAADGLRTRPTSIVRSSPRPRRARR